MVGMAGPRGALVARRPWGLCVDVVLYVTACAHTVGQTSTCAIFCLRLVERKFILSFHIWRVSTRDFVVAAGGARCLAGLRDRTPDADGASGEAARARRGPPGSAPPAPLHLQRREQTRATESETDDCSAREAFDFEAEGMTARAPTVEHNFLRVATSEERRRESGSSVAVRTL